jgi:2-C-methyl-D-erythritol 4-phosphate cytidylyltransferase
MSASEAPRRVLAVIPAAGTGSRMKSAVNKQFLSIDGVPVVARTFCAFADHAGVDAIVVVASAGAERTMRALCEEYAPGRVLAVVTGGPTRQDSVRRGLEALLAADAGPIDTQIPTVVLIHDGARPFVSDALIDRCIAGALRFGACAAAVPVKDTIKVVDGSLRVLSTPDRTTLWAVQTPQAFLLTVLQKALRHVADSGFIGTDDTSLAEAAGIPVHLVEGDYDNLKITTPEDLRAAQGLARGRKNS